ncbi:oxidoreductase [Nocardioides sp. OK12]|uniref:aldo/keto reductase n=1 Tax=Nocardioides sp. OK12 TaxID=2758661 RepID=UPI0021C39C29|nr:aldo/keto reductase [Nocardioides sp. OK12]GHJ59737.1 oxidoreductase [Nocardioides sp. OK12]
MSSAERDLRLGLGGARLGNHLVALDDAGARAVLDEAWERGVRLFDTAPHYGLGLSERRLGDFLAGRDRQQFRISTKVGRRLVEQPNPEGAVDDEDFLVPADRRRVWDFSEAGIRATLEQSLERLGLDHVDAVYLHDPERFDLGRALAEGLPALQRLKDEGLVGAVGVASMRLDALVAAVREGPVDELMVAGRYTLIDQQAVEELLPLCEARGVDVVAAAVFNGGLLAGPPDAGSTYDYAAVPEVVLDRARALDRACREAGVPVQAAALQFPLRHPAVRSVVVGVGGPAEIADDVRLLEIEVPAALWSQLERTVPS